MKNFKFAITDNTTYTGKDALDFYSKALLEGSSKSTFAVIPNVKSKIKLPRYDAGEIIKDEGCSWSPSGEGALSQKTFEVCSKDIQLELCTNTFEKNFLGELLRPGSNTGEVAPADFVDYMLNQVGKQIQNDLEIVVWQGNTGSTAYPYSVCNGIVVKALADPGVVDVTGPSGGITISNVIAEITKVYDKIPVTIIDNEDLVIYVSDYIAGLYMQAVAAASNEAYYVGAKELNFLGIKMVRAKGMSAQTMVAGLRTNFVLLTDLLSDEMSLNVIPQANLTGTRTVRIAGNFKFGVDYKVSEEVVLYQPM